jgi:hypothetical protein
MIKLPSSERQRFRVASRASKASNPCGSANPNHFNTAASWNARTISSAKLTVLIWFGSTAMSEFCISFFNKFACSPNVCFSSDKSFVVVRRRLFVLFIRKGFRKHPSAWSLGEPSARLTQGALQWGTGVGQLMGCPTAGYTK